MKKLLLLGGIICSLMVQVNGQNIAELVPTALDQEGSYFFGWSPEGSIAYAIVEIVGGPVGYLPYVTVKIQDTITDNTLYEEDLDIDADYLYDNEFDTLAQITSFLSKNEHLVLELFQEYNIDISQSYELVNFPFTFKEANYRVISNESTITREIQDWESPSPYSVEALDTVSIFVEKDGSSKRVYSRNYGNIVYDINFAGVIISPFEDRSVIFLYESFDRSNGGSGSGLTGVGAHLIFGF
jgi:hypothetical protein